MHLKFASLPIIAISLSLLVACGQVKPIDDVGSYIDASIQGEERKLMIGIMTNIPASDRDNLIYLDDTGKIHANKPGLHNVLTPLKQNSNGSYTLPNGEVLRFAPCDRPGTMKELSTNYSCGAEAGASYRRVASKDGYSYAQSTITLPGPGLATLNKATGVYAMMGGRSSSNHEVDAGLLYSPTNNWWTNFIRLNGSTVYCYDNSCSTSPSTVNRVSPGSVKMEFYVPATNQVALRTSASSAGSPNYTIIVSAANSNWTPGGTAQRVKRTTSMVGSTSGDNINNITWSGSTLGTSASTATPWSSTTVQTDTNWTCKSGQVTVRYTDQSNESIDLAY